MILIWWVSPNLVHTAVVSLLIKDMVATHAVQARYDLAALGSLFNPWCFVQTFSETLFLQKYGRELESAHMYLRRYQRSGNRHDIDQCWMFYLKVFSRLLKDTQNLKRLDLREVSASLAEMKDLQLAVPGEYCRISSFITLQ